MGNESNIVWNTPWNSAIWYRLKVNDLNSKSIEQFTKRKTNFECLALETISFNRMCMRSCKQQVRSKTNGFVCVSIHFWILLVHGRKWAVLAHCSAANERARVFDVHFPFQFNWKLRSNWKYMHVVRYTFLVEFCTRISCVFVISFPGIFLIKCGFSTCEKSEPIWLENSGEIEILTLCVLLYCWQQLLINGHSFIFQWEKLIEF